MVSLGLPAAYLERFGRMPVGVGACGLAVERGEPVIVEDVEAEGPVGRRELGRGRAAGRLPGLFQRPAGQPQRRAARHDHHLLPRAAPPVGAAAPAWSSSTSARPPTPIDNARRHLAVRESDRRKEEFLATLAHELRNPLAAIQTSAPVAPARRPRRGDARRGPRHDRPPGPPHGAAGRGPARRHPHLPRHDRGAQGAGRPGRDRRPAPSRTSGRWSRPARINWSSPCRRSPCAWRPTRPGWSRSWPTC